MRAKAGWNDARRHDERVWRKNAAPVSLILLFFFPTAVYALQHAGEGILDYTLEVSFDIEASKIKGVATIPVRKGQEIKLEKGRLNLIYVSLDKQEIDISHRDETVRILSSREGTIEIRYEGIFRKP